MTTGKEVPIETELAVRRLIARYNQLMDDRDFDQLVELYAEDGRLNSVGTDMRGRSAIRQWLDTTSDRQLHITSNSVISNGSHDNVHALSDCIIGARSEGGWSIVSVCRTHDTLVGEGREMRFTQRIFTAR